MDCSPTPIRVLYLEDDEDLARLVQRRLERAGVRVDVAMDGESGLATLADGDYDLVAVDYDLPGMDGLEVLRRLAEDRAPPLGTF